MPIASFKRWMFHPHSYIAGDERYLRETLNLDLYPGSSPIGKEKEESLFTWLERKSEAEVE